MAGPPRDAVGGMATVANQILDLDFQGRFRIEYVPNTTSSGSAEPRIAKVMRHRRQLQRLRDAIRAVGAPIVHLHTCSGFSFFRSAADMLTAQRSGARVILHMHGAAFDEFYSDSNAVVRQLIARSLARADAVVALSRQWGDQLRAMAPLARVHVIENAVALPPRLPRQPGATGSEAVRFALLARMDIWKGVDDLLSACKRLRDDGVAFEVTLAGPAGTAGDERTLSATIAALGLAGVVHYVGPVQGEEKVRLLSASDVYVQPSHHEGMPISLLEALAFGLPVVATRVGAVPEVVTDGREGLLVPRQSPEELARAMRHLLDNALLRRQMSTAARNLARQRFTLTRLAGNLTALYHDLLAVPARVVVHSRFPLRGAAPRRLV
jgi:glycosyltransferase involved in cell wall biosynthesis